MMEKHPDHTATFEYPDERYWVKVGNTVVADSVNVVLLKEVSPKGTYPPVPYFPLEDVRQELLTKTDLQTYCPLKGDASYYTLTAEGQTLENAVWYYPEPYDYVKEIDGYVAFYPNKVSIEIVDEA